MNHALIVDDNMAIGRAIKNRLAALGFDSFDHVWSEDQAIAAAASHAPDLVVLGDHVASGSPTNNPRSKVRANSFCPR